MAAAQYDVFLALKCLSWSMAETSDVMVMEKARYKPWMVILPDALLAGKASHYLKYVTILVKQMGATPKG